MTSRLPGWGNYLDSFHAQRPGITEDVLARCTNGDGTSPYAWLTDGIEAEGHCWTSRAAAVRPVRWSRAPGSASIDRPRNSTARDGFDDAHVPEIASLLATRLGSMRGVDEVVRYTVGPSVGCHTGVGTVGAVFYER